MDYTVYFIIKKNRHGYLNQHTVTAKNQREAIQKTRKHVKENSGRTAFNCTFEAPVKRKDGMSFGGKIYTRYSELFNMMW